MSRLSDSVRRLLHTGLDRLTHPRKPRSARPVVGRSATDEPTTRTTRATPTRDYPGDFEGVPTIVYDPHPDGEPDPGEIVWAWVPYEEDHSRGKDRPVLLIGHDGPWLLALQMSSKDRNDNTEHERRQGRIWVDIGSGAWDHRGRPSEARVNRILRIDPDAIRREGAVLDEAVFADVAAAVEAALA